MEAHISFLRFGLNFFESQPTISWDGRCNTAAATTGPARHPLPTSSVPIIQRSVILYVSKKKEKVINENIFY